MLTLSVDVIFYIDIAAIIGLVNQVTAYGHDIPLANATNERK